MGWHDGLPAETRMCLASPTPAGDQPLAPLRWQSATHRYDHGKYPPAMSTSLGSWPGAMSDGDKTVWDPWGTDAAFAKVRFWTRRTAP